jgi:hypothetical protein
LQKVLSWAKRGLLSEEGLEGISFAEVTRFPSGIYFFAESLGRGLEGFEMKTVSWLYRSDYRLGREQVSLSRDPRPRSSTSTIAPPVASTPRCFDHGERALRGGSIQQTLRQSGIAKTATVSIRGAESHTRGDDGGCLNVLGILLSLNATVAMRSPFSDRIAMAMDSVTQVE